MGTVFRKTVTRPLPAGAELTDRAGTRTARWRVRGKWRTAPVTTGTDGGPRLVTRAGTYTAKFRDHAGNVVERPTGCRDEAAARQVLARWEREAEQVRAGTLDPRRLEAAKRAAAPLADHLDAHGRALAAAGSSGVYRANLRRAVERVAREAAADRLPDLTRDRAERWLADRAAEGMSARTRNYYRESLVAFANWCVAAGRLPEHDLGRLPKADPRADPRRALTAAELGRLLAVAVARPLDDARTVRRGQDKRKKTGELRPETAARLAAVGRERALIYKTLVLTGLRANELRTLTVGQLHLAPGAEHLVLDAADEKSRKGNALAVRADLADDLRTWLAEHPGKGAGDPVFTVPTGLRRILDRDLKATGIPKRDDRGRTVDVHALRTTFGTLLSAAGVSPRTAQQAMRHSDLKLTMGVYTDPRLLDTRAAVERLPRLCLPGCVAPVVAPAGGHSGPMESTDVHSANGIGG